MLSHETPSRYPHQTEAVEAVLGTLQNHDRTHLVMACGTGKTRVALWVAEALHPKRVVVFVPSLALISQFIKEWRRVTVWEAIAYLAICSDETVRHAMDDQVVLDPTACDFPVTTDPAVVEQFLKQPSRGAQLVY
ncbi:MAG: DEAD/DEAH box helicase family protein [Gammaproteobacteria bacterium]|nr:DEAD/DEAH box helicase family protein [Gammaproteobacteria bacterium]